LECLTTGTELPENVNFKQVFAMTHQLYIHNEHCCWCYWQVLSQRIIL